MEKKGLANIKLNKRCAFCKHWYDPSNECIEPQAPSIGMWKYDSSAKRKCLKKNLNMSAIGNCSNYQCKV